MKNFSSERGKNANELDYIITSPCPKENPCSMCYMKTHEYVGEIIHKDIDQILNEINLFREQGYVIYPVTEDLLNHENGIDILKAARQQHVLTTGIPLIKDETLFSRLKEAGIRQIVYSANLPEVAEAFELPELELTKKAISMSKKNGLGVMTSFIVCSKNYDRVKEMAEHAKFLGSGTIRFLEYVPFCNQSYSLNENMRRTFMELSYRVQEEYSKEELYFSREMPFSNHKKGN